MSYCPRKNHAASVTNCFWVHLACAFRDCNTFFSLSALWGERWAHIHQGGMTLHSTQKIVSLSGPLSGGLALVLYLVSHCLELPVQHSKDTLHPYHTRKMALSGLPPHMLHPQTDLPQLDFIVIPWVTQLLPKSSLVISVPIQVPIVLCFSWEVMNKCLFTLDRALMTNNSTLVWHSERMELLRLPKGVRATLGSHIPECTPAWVMTQRSCIPDVSHTTSRAPLRSHLSHSSLRSI